MNVLIAGDFYITDSFKNHTLIDSSVEKLFASADYRIVNLEAPLTANEPKNRILKTGPHLRSSEETMLPYLKQLKVDMLTLANNHILDYGTIGLYDTFRTLQENEIDYVGAGKNLQDATKPFTFEKEEMKIAILNFAENEWSIAEEDNPGANPLDIIDNVNQIKEAKATHEKVICIIHGGHEYYHLPSPHMVKQYRFYAEYGADAIVGHHTHCIGGYEVYNAVPIIYSLGNFLFTIPSKREEWYTGSLAKLHIEKEKPVLFELIPVRQHKNTFKTELLQDEKKIATIQQYEEINTAILSKTTLQQGWDDYIQKNSKQYLNSLAPTNYFGSRYLRAGFNRLGISKLFLNKQYLKLILNLMRCEAHADGIKTSIKKYLNGD